MVDPTILEEELFAVLSELFACVIIGSSISAVLYGITCLQTYLYFQRYPEDRAYLRITVGTLWLLDTLATVLLSHAQYTYFVFNYRTLIDDLIIPWSFAAENGVTLLIIFVVQCYFAISLWRFARQNKMLVGSIIVLAVISFGLGMQATVRLFLDHTVAGLGIRSNRIIGGIFQSTAALCDVLITGGLCYYLDARRSGIRTTDSILSRLVGYAIKRGALTALSQIALFITWIAFPNRPYFIPLQTSGGKLYVNALLAR
ncbi:hypothetical protein BV20DRAFT_828113 [Pilatotrama ljubarskyi]|nr:hypothetical protein BV20DRAFT_828113 [Pilatotrama ljubarskyi]